MKRVHVVVALIISEGKILIALRPDHLHQGGLWEFPGGKVDEGEMPDAALTREIKEELSLLVLKSEPLFHIRHDYADKSVLLDIWRVTEFTGQAAGSEGQQIAWVALKDLEQFKFPAANREILDYLRNEYSEVP